MTTQIDIELLEQENPANWTPDRELIQRWLTHAMDENGSFELCIKIVSSSEIKDINSQFRNKDKATNVLSFPASNSIPSEVYEQLSPKPLGDLLLCPTVIEQEAKEQNKTLEAHWAHLCIHGLLHLVGYDHIEDEDALIMEAVEIKCLEQLGFNNPYLMPLIGK